LGPAKLVAVVAGALRVKSVWPMTSLATVLLSGLSYQNSTHFTQGSTLRTLQEILGVTPS
jgi:hypothetical protein